ncbi:MAG TPA: phospholipase D-like domain-containing protein [Xanthomonadales bacterium]|nr:phospholipase D-like domain-containing protein [Xanthomonadales bacterium]
MSSNLAVNPYLVIGVIEIALALIVGCHALLYKRDVRSSTFWILLILFVPWLGMLLYFLFGVNRIQREAPRLSGTVNACPEPGGVSGMDQLLPPPADCWQFDVLENGDAAYPRMLEAIANSNTEVILSTYIFANDRAGAEFIAYLKAACERGVAVFVLLDGVGIWYSFPPVTWALKKARVPHSVFLPTFAPWSTRFMNLRNHRKLLVVDRHQVFLGGMNIREAHMHSLQPKSPITDVHFHLTGELVATLVDQFTKAWKFANRGRSVTPHPVERVEQTERMSKAPTAIRTRVIEDGPDLAVPRLAALLLVKLSEAKSHIRIVVPYFLPDRVYISALTTAALRGVRIDVIVPRKNNLPWMSWALHATAWQLLEHGVRIFETIGEFDHSKIFVVDNSCAIVGSSNWDARSFRLNFELNLEVASPDVIRRLNTLIDRKLAGAHELTCQDVNGRSLPCQIRDGLARLFLPVL